MYSFLSNPDFAVEIYYVKKMLQTPVFIAFFPLTTISTAKSGLNKFVFQN
jgi:hypothetical protein